MSKSNYVLLFILEIHLSVFFARQFLLFERKNMKLIKSSAWNELWLRLTLELFSKLNRPSHLKIHLCFFSLFKNSSYFFCWKFDFSLLNWKMPENYDNKNLYFFKHITNENKYGIPCNLELCARKKSNKF